MKLFDPEQLPPQDLDLLALMPVVEKANRAIATLEGLFYGIPNPNVLLSPITTQEAVLSSKIEGTSDGVKPQCLISARPHDRPERGAGHQEGTSITGQVSMGRPAFPGAGCVSFLRCRARQPGGARLVGAGEHHRRDSPTRLRR